MNKIRILFPVIFGFMITFGLVGGLAQIGSVIAAAEAPAATTIFVDADATGGGYRAGLVECLYDRTGCLGGCHQR